MSFSQLFFGIGASALAFSYAFARIYKPEESFRDLLFIATLFFIVIFLRYS